MYFGFFFFTGKRECDGIGYMCVGIIWYHINEYYIKLVSIYM